jgi:glycosyltransferase involved in cell wall biosynthesis
MYSPLPRQDAPPDTFSEVKIYLDPAFIGIFDSGFYAAHNPDIANTREGEPLEHFLAFGRFEGRDPSPLFNAAYYKGQCGREDDGSDPLSHYVAIGSRLGLSPHPLFDPAYYTAQLPPNDRPEVSLHHYLTVGWRLGLSPHPLFDADYYAEHANIPDDVCPLVHYLMRSEFNALPHYLFSDAFYVAEIGKIAKTQPRASYNGGAPLLHYVQAGHRFRPRTHPLFDPRIYSARLLELARRSSDDALAESAAKSEDLLQHYVVRGEVLGISPSAYFDRDFYLSQLASVPEGDPLRHYLANRGFARTSPHPGIDLAQYARSARTFYPDDVPSILHLIASGPGAEASPHAAFELEDYRSRFSDIQQYEDGPILHFLAHGMAEGREPNSFFSADYVLNQEPLIDFSRTSACRHYFSSDWTKRVRVVFVSHDASLTGAPGTVLRLMEDFCRLSDVECFAIIGNSGPRVPDFKRAAHTFLLHKAFYTCGPGEIRSVVDRLCRITEGNKPVVAIVNSAESRFVGVELARAGIPVITLVHEAADLYPTGALDAIFAASSKVIFGSEYVFERAKRLTALDQSAALIRGQGLQQDRMGRMPRNVARTAVLKELDLSEDVFLVLGCGSIDYRKGTDLFVATALRFLERKPADLNVQFIWVGEGPTGNTSLQAFVMTDIRMREADQQIRFLGNRSNVEPYFVAADAFLMTSRIDPFPCVVQEAMAASLPTIAFTGGGGTPELLEEDAGICVPLGDTAAMADALLRVIRDEKYRHQLGQAARQKIADKYRFDDYFEYLRGLASEVSGIPERAFGRWAPKIARSDERRVYVLSEDWSDGPRHHALERFVFSLIDHGFSAELLFARGRWSDIRGDQLPRCPYRFLQPENASHDGGRWRTSPEKVWSALSRFLDDSAPCVVLTGNDPVAAAVVSLLPENVGTIANPNAMPGDYLQRNWTALSAHDRIIIPSHRCQMEVQRFPDLVHQATVVLPWAPIDAKAEITSDRVGGGADLRIVAHGDFFGTPEIAQQLLSLCRLLERAGCRFRLILNGEKRGLSERQRLANSFSELTSQIGFVVDAQNLKDETSRCDFALFFRWGYSDATAVIEAMASGVVPIVMTADPDFASIVQSWTTGFVTRPSDVKGVAAWMAELLDDEGKLSLVSRRTRAAIFDQGLTASQASAKYAEVLIELFSAIENGSLIRPYRDHVTRDGLDIAAIPREVKGLASPARVWAEQLFPAR